MSNLISALFPEGQRKVMVNLIVVLVGLVVDKFAGGLTSNLTTILIAVAAIFTGGNVLANIGGIIAGLKGTKVGQVIEDILPGDQGLGAQAQAMVVDTARQEVAGATSALADKMAAIERQLQVQAQNTSAIVQIINQMRGANVPKPPSA